jgi:hypothetical protein
MKQVFAKLMSMDEATWARHANPMSVWTRVITGIPLTFCAVWSIQILGYQSIVVIAVVALWFWLNPRLFPIPKSTDNWASKVTLGEQIWLNEPKSSIPNHHRNWIIFLTTMAGIGFIVGITGAYYNILLPTLVGGTISWFGKMWFCDRMVWLYEDMQLRKDD